MIFADAWAQIRAYPARLVAIVLSVLLGVGFLSATAVFTATSAEGLKLTAAAPLTKADIVIDRDSEVADPDWVKNLGGVGGLSSVDATYAATLDVFGATTRGSANVLSIPATERTRWFALDTGAWPQAANEIVGDKKTLDSLGLRVGDTVDFRNADSPLETATVVGSADLGFQPLTGADYRFYAPASFFGAATPQLALATVSDTSQLEQTITQLNEALPAELTAGSAKAQATEAASRFAGGTDQLTYIVLAFALIALLASVMVIANTFGILLAQRQRQTALLRLAGATRSQVRNLILAEAAIVGVAGALLGVVAGIGLGFGGASLMSLAGGGLVVDPVALLGCVGLGIVATVGAAWIPARHATRIPPVHALTGASDASTSARTGRAMPAAGVAGVCLGILAMTAGVVLASLPLALLGGLVSAIGLLMVLKKLVGALLPLTERVLARLGVAAELAGANLQRNSGRTATAAMALILGSSLIVALSVAASSGQATVDADLHARYPVDVSVTSDDPAISPATVTSIAGIPGLDLSETVPEASISLPEAGRASVQTVVGISAPMAAAASADRLVKPTGQRPVMLLPAAYLAATGVAEGSLVTASIDGRTAEFRAYGSRLGDSTGRMVAVVRSGDLASLAAGETTTKSLWAIASPTADRERIEADLDRIAAHDPSVTKAGALTERTDIANILSILMNLSLAMLMITVLIAVIGVANVLGLSVLERTREIALLRAMGARRRLLQTSLAIEAGVLALIAALIGILIGVPYGLVGINTVVGHTAPLVVDIPVGRLVLVLVLAIVAGIVASVIPAVRASRIQPAHGLAVE